MSIKDLLWNQYRYPLPAPSPFFSYQWDTNAIPLSANTKYVPVTGMPPASQFGITDAIVQIAMITTGFLNDDLQFVGYQNYDLEAGTLDILVNTITNATTRFLIFVVQKSGV